MRFCWRRLLILSLAMCAWGIQTILAQQAAKPLTERELVYLLEKKVSSSALADMVQSYGVTFAADADVLDRLKRAGANNGLLETIQRRAKMLNLQVEGTKSEPATPEPEAVPAPAREHLQLGQQKAKDYDYEGALEEFGQAERILPHWDQVLNQRGLALAALTRYSEAAAEWKKYLSSAPANTDKAAIQRQISEWESTAAKIEKTRALLVQGDQQLGRGDARGATQSFREAVALNQSVGTLLALARAQLHEGDYDGLAKTARQAEALDAQSALAKLYLADAELRQGNSDVSTLGQGLSLNPNLAYGRALLIRELRRRAGQAGGQQKQAKAMGANAASAEERNRRGWALWNGGHFQPALEELYKATLLNPAQDGLQCELAYGRLAQRDTAGAMAAAREAVRVNSGSACGHHALALAMERSGRHDQAALEFQEAEKLSSALGAESLLRLGAPAGSSRTDTR